LGGNLTAIGDAAIGTGPITLTNNGSLQMNGLGAQTPTTTFANSILVPAGTTGNLKTGGRTTYSSSITAHGTLNLTTSYVRSSPTGDWSASDGQINILAGSGGGDVYLNSANTINFGTATLDLGAGVNMYNSANTFATGHTIIIGALTGTGTIQDCNASGGTNRITTLVVGGRNSDFTFAGTIKNSLRQTSINKVGSGIWTLSGNNIYTASTIISSGAIVLGNGSAFMAASTNIVVAAGALFDVSVYNGLTLSAGQTLGGSGVVTGLVTAVAGNIINAGVGIVPGTLSFSNSLTLDGSVGYVTNNFNLSSDPSGLSKTNGKIIIAGDLNLTSTNIVTINALNNILGAGTYTLFKYSGTLMTNGVAAGAGTLENNFVAGGAFAANSHVTLTFSNTVNNEVVMVVTPNGNSLVWQGGVFGTATNNWDLNVSTNWLAGAAVTNFLTYDSVTFDNTATNFNAILAGTLAPGAVTVNSTNAFTFSGSGKISGTTGITKNGTNVLTISNTGGNDFSGTVTINDGIVKAGSATALGSSNGPTVISGTGALDIGGQNLGTEPVTVSGSGIGGAGAIQNSGAAVQIGLQFVTLAGNTTFGGTNRWDIRTNALGAYLNGNGYTLTKTSGNDIYLVNVGNANLGNVQIQQGRIGVQDNTLLGSSGTLIVSAGAGLDFWNNTVTNTKAMSLTNATVSSSNGTNVYGGTIALTGTNTFTAATPFQLNGALGGAGGLLKLGASALTLTGSSTYTGNTIISNAALALVGTASIASSASVDLAVAGAQLNVAGLSGGTVTLGSAQTLKGIGSVIGSVTAPVGSTVAPGEAGVAGTLTVTNTATLGGTTLMLINNAGTSSKLIATNIVYGGTLTVNNIGGTLVAGNSFQLFGGANSGTFSTLNLPVLGAGLGWSNSLAANGSLTVVATVNPNPTNFTFVINGSNLELTWPADHTGWRLQAQTNNIATGLSGNWVDIAGTASDNHYTNTINPANGAVFYRMVYP
jgi:autotransporter-associated beta strand protein